MDQEIKEDKIEIREDWMAHKVTGTKFNFGIVIAIGSVLYMIYRIINGGLSNG